MRAPAILGLTAGSLVSLAPGLIPRAAVLQGLATGVCAAAGLGVGLLCAGVLSRLRPAAAWALSLPLLAGALWLATAHQNNLRAVMAQPGIDLSYWPFVAAIAVVVTAALAAAARLVRRAGLPRTALAGALAVAVAVPTGQAWLSHQDSVLEAGVAQPFSATRAGSPESLIPWKSVGVHGRRFLADVTSPASVRVYAGLSSAPSPAARAALAADELVRAGGLQRGAVVLAVPTGSGWIDESAAAGFERRFDGDVAIVGIQYARTPSWVGYLLDPGGAAESAQALFDAVAAKIATVSPAERPPLYLYGQSLGAVGASAVQGGRQLCGVVAVGPPPGAAAAPGSVVLANASDPVVRWSPTLLIEPAGDGPWLPVVSFAQTSIDVLGALGLPAGNGHVYGEEQALTLPTCPSADRRELVRTVASNVAAPHAGRGEPQ